MRRLLPTVIDVIRAHESNNPETILRAMHVNIYPHNIIFLPDAFYVRLGQMQSISIKTSLSEDARNVALAHELGHIVLRHLLDSFVHADRLSAARHDEKELAANKFAFLLLAHTCLRNNVRMIDSIRGEKLLSLADTASLLKQLECAACVYE